MPGIGGYWVDVENPYGTKLGPGPIYTARNWESSVVLDGVGNFTFTMPASDPRCEYLVEKRFVRCYTILSGVVQEVGDGLIDNISVSMEGTNEPMLTVSGRGLGQELAQRTVGNLDIYTPAPIRTVMPDQILEHDPVTDTNTVITPPTTVSLANTEYIYIRHRTRVDGVHWELGATKNTVVSSMTVQYFSSLTEWTGVPTFVDGTLSEGKTWGATGTMTWDNAQDCEPTKHGGVTAYWIRMIPSATLTNNVNIDEVSIRAHQPSATALADIMVYAPTGWTVSGGYAATKKTVMLMFSGESVLNALVKVAEHTGEHFYVDTGRKVVWLQDDPRNNPTASGIRAVTGALQI